MTVMESESPARSLRPTRLRRLAPVALVAVLVCAPGAAQARKLLLTCQDGSHKYTVSFDTLARKLATTHKDFNRDLEVERVQEDGEGVMVWGVMRLGTATRNILVHFGAQKWARHFRGYNETWTNSCI